MHTTYFIQALYGSDPCVRSYRAEKPLQNADFAMKQTNICRLSGDIKNITGKTEDLPLLRTGGLITLYSHEDAKLIGDINSLLLLFIYNRFIGASPSERSWSVHFL